jgi:hypothetical protein
MACTAEEMEGRRPERRWDDGTEPSVQLLLLPYFWPAHGRHFQALTLCPTVPITVPARGCN